MGPVKLVKHIPLLGVNTVTTVNTSYTNTSYYAPEHYIDKTLWDGTVEIYFEAVLSSSNASGVAYAALYTDGGTYITDSEVSVSGTTVTRVRSGNIAGNIAGGDEYEYRIKTNNASYTTTLSQARLVIVQSGYVNKTTTICCLTGYKGQVLSNSYSMFGNVNQFRYTANNWDGQVSIFFECFAYSSSGDTTYVKLCDTDGNEVDGSELTISTTTATNYTSPAITLTDGKDYCIKLKGTNASGDIIYLVSAKILIVQTNSRKGETHMEIKSSGTNTTTSATMNGHVYYDNEEWVGINKKVYFDTTLRSSASNGTIYSDLYNSTGIKETVSSIGQSYILDRSDQLSMTDNENYYAILRSGDGSSVSNYGPKLVVVYNDPALDSYSSILPSFKKGLI